MCTGYLGHAGLEDFLLYLRVCLEEYGTTL